MPMLVATCGWCFLAEFFSDRILSFIVHKTFIREWEFRATHKTSRFGSVELVDDLFV